MFSLKDIFDIKLDGSIAIVDIGAMYTGLPRYDKLTKTYQSVVTGFEPNEIEFSKLQLMQPLVNYLPHFIGSGEEATFHITRFPGCSSLYESDPNLVDLFTSIGVSNGGSFEVLSQERVKTTRLDDIYNLPQAHYIKLDIQGAELSALQGAIQTLKSALVLEVEVEFVPLYKNQPLFGDIQCFLRDQGFVLHKFIDVEGRCFRPLQFPHNPYLPMSQILSADAIFIRDFTQFHDLEANELLILAIIMHEMYLSYDLVHFTLSKYDEMQKTDFKTVYLQELSNTPQLATMFLNQKASSGRV